MNDYIINPWFFYFLSLVGNINCLLGVTLVASACIVIVCWVGWLINTEAGTVQTPEAKNLWKMAKVSTITACVLACIGCIMPSKTTLLQMMVAEHVTHSNLKSLKKEAKGLVDYVIEKVDKLNDKKK